MASGNACLFYLFQLFNLALILGSAGEVVSSAFVLRTCALQWSEIGFLTLGGCSLVLALAGLGARRTAWLLFFYIALLLVGAAVQAGFALAALFLAHYSDCLSTQLANLYCFAMLGFSAVQLTSAVFAWFYRESLCNAQYEEEEAAPVVQGTKQPEAAGNYARLKGNYNR